MKTTKQLLSIIEMGGYPDFNALYKQHGFEPHVVYSMRKALNELKRNMPDVVVAEFNYQSDFRDRTSSLESLIAIAQRSNEIKVIVFYEKEYEHQFEKLKTRYDFFASLSFPIEKKHMESVLARL